MGVQSEYAVIDKVENYDPDNAYFDYTVKCTLLKDGKLITEGLGNGNTREKKEPAKFFRRWCQGSRSQCSVWRKEHSAKDG